MSSAPHSGKHLDLFRQAIAQIFNNPRFRSTLQDLDEHAQARNEATGNAAAYLKRKGGEIPDELHVWVDAGRWSIKCYGWGFCLTLDTHA